MVRTSGLLTLLATATTAVIAQADALDVKPAAPQAIPGAYLIEFEEGHDRVAALAAVQEDATTRLELDYELFQGVSIQLNDVKTAEDKADKLAALPAVKNIWPVVKVPRPEPKIQWVATDGLETLTKIAPSSSLSSRADADQLSSAQRMGQIEKLRAKGYRGRGIKVGVVDSGVDYTHPALGKCFGEGCLVTYGYDLVGDHYGTDGDYTPKPDNDPMDCYGHGTHVAGIIAAQENPYNFTGVAPDVKLGAFRVFGCQGSTGTDVLISAFNKAYQAGSDIITASIGGPSGWMDEPWALSISRIVARGVPCTIAAGNEGTDGLFYPSSGSSGQGAVSVASFDNTDTPVLSNVDYFSVDGGDKQQFLVTPSNNDAWDGVTLDLWAGSYDVNKTDDGCDPYPADTPDLSQKIVLIHRGTCSFVQKAQNAIAHGANYMIVYNNVPATVSMDLTGVSLKGGSVVTSQQGAAFIGLLKAGKKVTVSMNSTAKSGKVLAEGPNTVTGGALSSYTTWGPSWELNVKPDVGAPGGNILSTYPVAKGSYAVESGTSMACPFTAASVALLLEVRGKKTSPATITNLLSANANPQLFNDNTQFYNQLAPVAQQGAGLIQVYDAAFATSLLEPSNLAFNDTAHLAKKLTFKLSNTGKESVTYNVGQVSAITMYTLGASGTHVQAFPNEAVDAYAQLSFSQDKITIGAGGSASVDVSATPPAGVDGKRLPVWSGYVTINGTDGTSLSMPYQGVSGSMLASTVLASSDAWISLSGDTKYIPVTANQTFTLPKQGTGVDNGKLPAFVYNLSLGSKNITGHLQPMTTCPPNSTYEYKGFKTIGQPSVFPALFKSRDANSDGGWDGSLNDGSFAPAGKYRLVVRALRVFGDASKDSDWDTAITPGFKINYST